MKDKEVVKDVLIMVNGIIERKGDKFKWLKILLNVGKYTQRCSKSRV